MGNTCKPMAVSFQCMTKSTTNKKKKMRMHSSHCREIWLSIESGHLGVHSSRGSNFCVPLTYI